MATLKNHARYYGSTGISLSPIGLGTVKFGRNEQVKYPEEFNIPDEDTLADLLQKALDLGINTLDTAPSYGMSEERLGRLLKHTRDQWVIVGKAGEWFEDGVSHFDFSPDAIERSVHESLERLKTDYIDILLLHSDGNDTDILSHDDLIKRLNDLKSQGLIKAHGASTKTIKGGCMAIERLDGAMIMHHPNYRKEETVIDMAQQHAKGIILKKALASGHIQNIGDNDPITASLICAFEKPSVASVMIGTINPEHLEQNVQSAMKALKLLLPKTEQYG